MNLIQPLPSGPLDIVGDIHGEYDALCNLLRHLGYDQHGRHEDGRTLVFVGDFCDRGPDSPAVLELVERFVKSGRAVAVLGNHEINLLREEAKDGSGWYFDARMARDHERYAPFNRPSPEAKANIVGFLSSLPIGLERADLRVIHAAWINEQINDVRTLPIGSILTHYDAWDTATERQANELAPRMAAERARWNHDLENPHLEPPFMHAHAEHDSVKQMTNPLRVLTSGVERKGKTTFYSSGKWRFAERVQWWNEYDDATPVVVGHYWRRVNKINRNAVGKGDPDLFDTTPPYSWHGKQGNVFCVDFSVGGRWSARKANKPVENDFKLAALQWPERMLRFDDGHVAATDGFMTCTNISVRLIKNDL
jgi:hypothetical protein